MSQIPQFINMPVQHLYLQHQYLSSVQNYHAWMAETASTSTLRRLHSLMVRDTQSMIENLNRLINELSPERCTQTASTDSTLIEIAPSSDTSQLERAGNLFQNQMSLAEAAP